MTNLLLLIALLCILFQGLMFLSLGFFVGFFSLRQGFALDNVMG
ncbi:hypothetical protein BSPLISOX_522 [uncultured Gammaproteobacteria bacterium]|nr:hypothetical protein [uncultured Gammaproteobacteria bacterium]VVH65324.1 hypothetical protein BSPLISOX_522 [uncultured Gammaproteobacteria bacterium]